MAVGDKQKLITEIVSKVLNEPAQTSKNLTGLLINITKKISANTFQQLIKFSNH